MKYYITLFLYLICFTRSFSQVKMIMPDIPDSLKPKIGCEKVYLHTDRSYYFAGEDIWFKAYLADAYTNLLINNSNILYVEMISPEAKIIGKRVVQMWDGIGTGDFRIDDSIKAGNYQLRAYTNWMRNFGDNYFFKKILTIENPEIKNKNKTRSVSTQNPAVDFQFFPEGGSIVDDIPVVIGFKAINSNGYGCDVSGKVFSSDGDTITGFESVHLGMGRFCLTPKRGLSYFAVGKTKDGTGFSANLPAGFARGIAMKDVLFNKDHLTLTLVTNTESFPDFSGKTIKLKVFMRNILLLMADLKLSTTMNNYSIPAKDLGDGIARVTITDNNNVHLCERLVYIHHKKQFTFSIIPDKEAFSPRSPVRLNISATDTSGIPVLSTVSISVTDGGIANDIDPYHSDIASYFLLESEIAGNIEQPGYYFDPSQKERFKNLDLLLLTQGWRDFKWKYLSNVSKVNTYPVEYGFCISGRLTRLLGKNPPQKTDVALGLIAGDEHYYTTTKTNSTGSFQFTNLLFSGNVTLVLSAANEKDKLKRIIYLDSIPKQSPLADSSFTDKKLVVQSAISALQNEAIKINTIKKKYGLKDTVILDEIIVTAEKPSDPEYYRPQIYYNSDYTIKISGSKTFAPDVFSAIAGKVAGLFVYGTYPEIRISIRGPGSVNAGQSPLFLLDGIQTDISAIAALNVNEIERVDIMKSIGNTSIFGIKGSNGVISIVTKQGGGAHYNPVLYSVNKIISGFDAPRKFYSPKYGTPNSSGQIPDLRTTIYWDPYIITGSDSIPDITFYNGDRQGLVEIRAEGVTQAGIPITSKIYYQVR